MSIPPHSDRAFLDRLKAEFQQMQRPAAAPDQVVAPQQYPAQKGVGAFPDRIAPMQDLEGPPSIFKKFLFDPIIEIARIIFWVIFSCFDALRNFAYFKAPRQ